MKKTLTFFSFFVFAFMMSFVFSGVSHAAELVKTDTSYYSKYYTKSTFMYEYKTGEKRVFNGYEYKDCVRMPQGGYMVEECDFFGNYDYLDVMTRVFKYERFQQDYARYTYYYSDGYVTTRDVLIRDYKVSESRTYSPYDKLNHRTVEFHHYETRMLHPIEEGKYYPTSKYRIYL